MLFEYFKIKSISDAVCGVSFKSRLRAETDIIMRAMRKSFETEQRETLVVGDTHFDIDGARINHKWTAPAFYGASEQNLNSLEAGANRIAEKPQDIESIALGFLNRPKKQTAFSVAELATVHEDTALCLLTEQ